MNDFLSDVSDLLTVCLVLSSILIGVYRGYHLLTVFGGLALAVLLIEWWRRFVSPLEKRGKEEKETKK